MLEDFQLVLNDGDKAVIIGEEGDGKSTLLKWIFDPALTEPYAERKAKASRMCPRGSWDGWRPKRGLNRIYISADSGWAAFRAGRR